MSGTKESHLSERNRRKSSSGSYVGKEIKRRTLWFSCGMWGLMSDLRSVLSFTLIASHFSGACWVQVFHDLSSGAYRSRGD